MKSIKSQPLVQLVKDEIFEYIKNTDLKDDKLPREETLSETLNVSRITLRGALKELSLEGFIFSKHGKGTFVNKEALRIKAPLTPLKPFKKIITDLGYECSVKNSSYQVVESVNEDIATSLKLEKEKRCIKIEKIFYADKKPSVYCIDFFSIDIIPSIDILKNIDSYENSIFEFFDAECKHKITWDMIEIATTTNIKMPELNDIFNCHDEFKDFLICKGINYDNDNNPICRNFEIIDTDIIQFNMIRKKYF